MAAVLRTSSRRIVRCYERVIVADTTAGTSTSTATFTTNHPAYCRRPRRPDTVRWLGASALPFSSRSLPVPVSVSFAVASTTET